MVAWLVVICVSLRAVWVVGADFLGSVFGWCCVAGLLHF